MTPIATIATLIGQLGVIAGFIGFLIKLWKKLQSVMEGQQCQLRSDITNIYYRHIDDPVPTLREYERLNLDDLYAGYKALGGNHYVDDIYNKMRDWKVKK